MSAASFARLSAEGEQQVLSMHGNWRLVNVGAISAELKRLQIPHKNRIIVDGGALEAIDTAGALSLFCALSDDENNTQCGLVDFRNLKEAHNDIVQLVREKLGDVCEIKPPHSLSLLEKIGKNSMLIGEKVNQLLSFLGETSLGVFSVLRSPRLIRPRELFVQLELVLLDAVPVVALVTFLIGIVLAYLFGIQIEQYGANIFIVDSVALAMCRELSPIIVAIIVAGRSGSSFTAHIGTMKLNEEIDALRTLGLSPMHVLVLPRLFALMIAMPFLVFVGDVVGILGGMLIAEIQLGITGHTFIERLSTVLPLRSFAVGLIKAPVFAAFIAIIGCRMGLTVEKNARSLGLNTTSTVVQSIVSVILLNAAFAVLFVELGI